MLPLSVPLPTPSPLMQKAAKPRFSLRTLSLCLCLVFCRSVCYEISKLTTYACSSLILGAAWLCTPAGGCDSLSTSGFTKGTLITNADTSCLGAIRGARGGPVGVPTPRAPQGGAGGGGEGRGSPKLPPGARAHIPLRPQEAWTSRRHYPRATRTPSSSSLITPMPGWCAC